MGLIIWFPINFISPTSYQLFQNDVNTNRMLRHLFVSQGWPLRERTDKVLEKFPYMQITGVLLN